MFWFHNWHPPQCIVMSVTNSRPCTSPTHHRILLNKTYQAPSVSSLCLASEGDELVWVAVPGVHGLAVVLAMGPGPPWPLDSWGWWRHRDVKRKAQHQHQPISTILRPAPRPQSWIAKYWWNLLILKILHLKYNLAQKSIYKTTNEVCTICSSIKCSQFSCLDNRIKTDILFYKHI